MQLFRWTLAAYLVALASVVLVKMFGGTASKVFSKAELAAYDGVAREEIFMSIMGQVFDVTQGARFYQHRTGGYDFFAATDGSLAFVTGDFKENVTDDVSSLTPTQLYQLSGWVTDTYHAKYVYKGLLDGYFYDSRGRETENMRRIQMLIAQEEIDMKKRKEDEKLYPKCNSKRAKGVNLVWCVGQRVPRKRSIYGGAERCACIVDADAADADQHNVQYPNCPRTNSTCPRN